MLAIAPTLVILAVGLCACATLDRGSTDRIYVLSDPAAAKAIASTGASCVTPCNLVVGRRDELAITVEKAGYVSQTVEVKTRPNARGVGDLMENVTTAGLGLAVDTATGAGLEHVPDPVKVTLKRVGSSSAGVKQAS